MGKEKKEQKNITKGFHIPITAANKERAHKRHEYQLARKVKRVEASLEKCSTPRELKKLENVCPKLCKDKRAEVASKIRGK